MEAESAAPQTATAVVELWRTNRHELATLEVSDELHDPARPDRKHAPTWVEPDMVLPARPGRIGWYHCNSKSVGPRLMAEVQGLTGFPQPDPLLHRTLGAVVIAAGPEAVNDRTLCSPRGPRHRFRVHVPVAGAEDLVALHQRRTRASRPARHDRARVAAFG